jgi:catechol 2,3-dioxygenase-like lactoylglutathione lyase family enzyme
MAIVGVHSLIYRVGEVGECIRFFEDFGLPLVDRNADCGVFEMPEGSTVTIRHRGDPTLPASSMVGDGVCQVIWGVDTAAALDRLVARLDGVVDVVRHDDGSATFVTPFGIAMGLAVYARRPVVYAPDPLNAPGVVNRLNQRRKWRERARPKLINHVVFAIPEYEEAAQFMQRYLGFKMTDNQRSYGMYLRADGSNNHHNLFLINASAPFPGLDGQTRFHHVNYGVEDLDEIMLGANHMVRKGWHPSHLGLGRHRIDSALFYYVPCPAGGEAEYGADADYVDDNWVPREWLQPLFGYTHFVHNLPPFLQVPPEWNFRYLTEEAELADKGAAE